MQRFIALIASTICLNAGATDAANLKNGEREEPASKDERKTSNRGKADARGGEKSGEKTRQTAKGRNTATLIPPPPPTVPYAGTLSGSAGLPVELLSPADLKQRKEELEKQLSTARKLAEDQEKLADETRQRSNLFASLYSEGVVSRRELENSQKEDARADDELKTARQKVSEIEHDLERVNGQLKKLEEKASAGKSKKPAGKDRARSEKKFD